MSTILDWMGIQIVAFQGDEENKQQIQPTFHIIYVDSGIRTQATSVEWASTLTSVLP